MATRVSLRVAGAAFAAVLLGACATPGEGDTSAPAAVSPTPTLVEAATPTPASSESPSPNSPTHDASPTAQPTEHAAFEDAQSCENDDIGFTVEYPGDWWANERIEPDFDGGTPIPACTYFAPEPVALQPNAGLPPGVAIWFNVPSANAADSSGEELDGGEATVDGYDATIVEYVPRESGFSPEGTIIYTYVIDRDGERISALTNAFGHEDTYEENKRILDSMMETLDFED